MKQMYEAEVLFELMERDGFNIPSSVPPYEAEIKAYLINQVKQAYPKLTDYEAEWLLYNYTKHIPADFPISSVSDVTNATFENVVPYAYQSAILKGNTGYRDIDTGEFLETFEEGRNLELVSVKMPVLTTSNEDGTKTNILTVNEDVTLRGIGAVQDELDCLTGELTQRIGEITLTSDIIMNNVIIHSTKTNKINAKIAIDYYPLKSTMPLCDMLPSISYDDYYADNDIEGISINKGGQQLISAIYLSILKSNLDSYDLNGVRAYLENRKFTSQFILATESVKTVDLTTINEKGEKVYFMPLEGTMHVQSSGEAIQPTFDMSVPVEATTQNLASFINLEMEE